MKRLILLLALTLCWYGYDAFGQTRTKKVESDGFVWYEIYKNGKCGAQDVNGRTIIPTQYKIISYITGADGWFDAMGDNWEESAYEKNGKCVISTNRGYSRVHKAINDGVYWYSIKKGDLEGVCDANGNEIIPPIYESVFYSDTDHEFRCKEVNGHYVYTGISLKGSSYASSSSSSSSLSYDYVFTYSYYTDRSFKTIKQKAIVSISKSSKVIRIEYGSNTYNFNFKEVLYSERSGEYDDVGGFGLLLAMADESEIKFVDENNNTVSLLQSGVIIFDDNLNALPIFSVHDCATARKMFKKIKDELCQ